MNRPPVHLCRRPLALYRTRLGISASLVVACLGAGEISQMRLVAEILWSLHWLLLHPHLCQAASNSLPPKSFSGVGVTTGSGECVEYTTCEHRTLVASPPATNCQFQASVQCAGAVKGFSRSVPDFSLVNGRRLGVPALSKAEMWGAQSPLLEKRPRPKGRSSTTFISSSQCPVRLQGAPPSTSSTSTHKWFIKHIGSCLSNNIRKSIAPAFAPLSRRGCCLESSKSARLRRLTDWWM